ncbi:hypothetical protein Q5424_25425 [Conexibacter sp. JD483]|uniref:hypothetical protein n=1 Tax=unclassified Conexibacter TaxID=2627773 RepID=UPI0027178AE5|nr:MULTISPECIES: hypothetical protein [unclassified Conexibacter]MDO8188160.1 hypothetical protein [Conexibacter sp. CPCC 205706]MDO8202006.1 hypothetical protein [Conexibacter sp. CPCC 205762]MDR9372464.1 hypothetical protein [Conexibacter sp. JD483]
MPRALRLIALPALLLLLLAPAAARADDQSFARTAITGAQTLLRYERATGSALQKVDRRGVPAVPGARRAIKQVRRQVDTLLKAVRPEQTSSPDGAVAKKTLFALLRREKDGYATLDRALTAYVAGDARTARTLLSRARRALAKVSSEAATLGAKLRELAA